MKVKLVEVGPRDGFQNVKTFIPTEVKLRMIEGLVQAGFKKIQITSFVNQKAIPQMKDAAVVAGAVLEQYEGVDFFALVPNFYGAKAAVEAGLMEIGPVISLSESHNKANVKRTVEESLEEMKKIRHTFPDIRMTQDIACVFGCPFEGEMEIEKLLELVGRLKTIGIDAFTLCDTVGLAYPTLIEAVFRAVRSEFPGVEFNAHIHDTRNMGILNSYIALQNGADSVQTAIGGLGGCPFAPGASGNTSSEDLVYMLNHCGYDTGIDFEILMNTARFARENIAGNYSGHQINITPNPCIVTQE
ncbi:hydroxymethylglutaryl-CoA lyase [Enterocloster bolteae]|uniref:hydroxymethylglutaryl-CoA lyase n=1 Tax=Enterocloster bolteae TaxID=208479 RepID=UPI00210D2F58|nr:hydroxymethylglutaryl-CoA lyase [Enterocloster bolteae]MCQ5146231.1 hydroxymethylglutaryl-CoA lyase [Enterocloster bolteae]